MGACLFPLVKHFDLKGKPISFCSCKGKTNIQLFYCSYQFTSCQTDIYILKKVPHTGYHSISKSVQIIIPIPKKPRQIDKHKEKLRNTKNTQKLKKISFLQTVRFVLKTNLLDQNYSMKTHKKNAGCFLLIFFSPVLHKSSLAIPEETVLPWQPSPGTPYFSSYNKMSIEQKHPIKSKKIVSNLKSKSQSKCLELTFQKPRSRTQIFIQTAFWPIVYVSLSVSFCLLTPLPPAHCILELCERETSDNVRKRTAYWRLKHEKLNSDIFLFI